MDTIYIVLRGYDYEGAEIERIFCDLSDAEEYIEANYMDADELELQVWAASTPEYKELPDSGYYRRARGGS